ncbi:uncharacterized protein LOC107606834 [Arachis ipaensis]|uniref:uncharacterized protein LOC107606834 n=1 Tax=Arachis ipaensis TaxID=130454 RepID=UPI0007AF7FA3|nr:uncharacterized protein LOC107606834 [Arachis ipaensis]XP_025664539.1 uncharacterized protein LOC112762958 [Arachis hypogaea]
MAEFVVLRDSMSYNLILGRKTINEFGAVIFTKMLLMKFVADDGSVGTIRGDLETAVACDNTSLSLRNKSKEASGNFLADLDARVDDKPRPEPEGDLEKFRVGDSEEKFTFVNRNLPHDLKEPLMEMIRANVELFAWTPADMPGIYPQLMSHRLAVKPDARPVAQRRRKMSQERAEEVARQTASLLEAGYSDLYKACPKDSYPLPNINTLVDAAARYQYLSFMDAYSGYNQIPMHRPDEEKMTFITLGGTKIFGVHDTQKGVEVNSEKCKAILQMKSPGCIKDVQRLTGRLTALSRFLGASAAKALPFLNLMRKGIAFEWTPACEEAFIHFKEVLATPPVLRKPKVGEPLYLYLAITDEAMAVVLVREEGKIQQPIYFVSKALQEAELRYSKLEKLALALLTSSRRLRQYFQGHQVVVRTDQGIRQHEPRQAIKAQVMADFLVEVTGNPTETTSIRWKLHVDGASNQTFGGARIILESPAGVIYEQLIKFEFPVSNNQAEYDALLGGLTLAREVGATRLEVCSDSQVVTSQVNGTYQARDSLLQKYLEKVKELSKQFEEVTIQHVPRKRNTQADLLSMLASTKPGAGNRSLIQSLVNEPAVVLQLTQSEPSWMDPIIDFLEKARLPSDDKLAKTIKREATKYAIIQGQLFKKGISQPLLKCLHPDQTDYVLREVHEGVLRSPHQGQSFSKKAH